ncbi:hypothetical protein L195_g063768, partial [Trifolium pratense]
MTNLRRGTCGAHK